MNTWLCTNYKILHLIVMTGNATIYHVQEIRSQKELVLKIIKASDEETYHIIKEGLQKSSKIASHEHVLPLTVEKYFNSTLEIACSLPFGLSLEKIIERGPIPAKRVLLMLNHIVDALYHANVYYGLTHQRIDPTNIFEINGTFKLGGWYKSALGPHHGSEIPLNKLNNYKLAKYFIAPELQKTNSNPDENESKENDNLESRSKADVFSLGVVLLLCFGCSEEDLKYFRESTTGSHDERKAEIISRMSQNEVFPDLTFGSLLESMLEKDLSYRIDLLTLFEKTKSYVNSLKSLDSLSYVDPDPLADDAFETARASLSNNSLDDAIENFERCLSIHSLNGSKKNSQLIKSDNSLDDTKEDKVNEAFSKYEKALESYEDLYGPSSEKAADNLVEYAKILQKFEKLSKAEQCLTRALGIYREMFGDGNAKVGECFHLLGDTQKGQENWIGASKSYKQAAESRKIAFGELHLSSLQSYIELGKVLIKTEEYDAAKKILENALDISKKVVGYKHPYVATCEFNLGKIEHAKKNEDSAINHYQQALFILSNASKESIKDVGECLIALADSCLIKGFNNDAQLYLEQGSRVLEKLKGKNNLFFLENLILEGDLFCKQEKFPKAIEKYTHALALAEDHFGRDHERVADVLLKIAIASFPQNQPEATRELLTNAKNIYSKRNAEANKLKIADCNMHIGRTLRMQYKLQSALKYLKDSLKTKEDLLGNSHQDVIQNEIEIAKVVAEGKDIKEAKKMLNNCLEKLTSSGSQQTELYADALCTLGELQRKKSSILKAKDLFKKSIDIYESLTTKPTSKIMKTKSLLI